MLTRKLLVAGAALCTGTIAAAQDYFDFGQIPGLPDVPAVQVDLNPTLIGIASETTRSANPAMANLLANIDGVRVRVYKSLEDVENLIEYVDEISEQLEREDWQQVVSVQDEGHVRVYMSSDNEAVTGLTGMVVGNAEAVFINIAGTIDPQQLAEFVASTGATDALASLGALGDIGQFGGPTASAD